MHYQQFFTLDLVVCDSNVSKMFDVLLVKFTGECDVTFGNFVIQRRFKSRLQKTLSFHWPVQSPHALLKIDTSAMRLFLNRVILDVPNEGRNREALVRFEKTGKFYKRVKCVLSGPVCVSRVKVLVMPIRCSTKNFP